MLESTRDTISIHHGTNGTAEKTTVDTNPLKVLEHENLISDSEYITLDHQTDVNKTHIKTESLKQELQQLHQTKQDTLIAGTGITIQGQTISASGGSAPVKGASVSIKRYNSADWQFEAYKHVVSSEQGTLTTFVFICASGTAEHVLSGELKEQLENYVYPNFTFSNGAISITDDGTNMKLINSKSNESGNQEGTFTFYNNPSSV